MDVLNCFQSRPINDNSNFSYFILYCISNSYVQLDNILYRALLFLDLLFVKQTHLYYLPLTQSSNVRNFSLYLNAVNAILIP